MGAFIRKLEQFVALSQTDKAILTRLSTERQRTLDARADIIRQGENPTDLYLLLSGWACRYKQLEDGRRQIVAFFLPGDLCDLNVFILRQMDHSIGALTPVSFAEISRTAFENATMTHPRVLQALWWETLVNAAIQREWTVNLGQRNASERMAHLLCELFLRLQGVGLTRRNSYDFPLTQADLADAAGLSSVHVNRTLQDLRNDGLIILKGKVLTIPDIEALKVAALFNPDYLHLDREGRHLDANH